jgi:outer membrane immunogenic protein
MRTIGPGGIAIRAAIVWVATLGAAGVAQADGMARKEAAAPVERPFTWTGAYVGAHIGYGWGGGNQLSDLNGYLSGFNASGFRVGEVDGAFVGVQSGYNFQFQRYVAGIEGDWGFLGTTGTAQFPPLVGVAPGDSNATIDMDYYGTITGRFGFLAGERVLIYAKAGWGWVHTRASFTDSNGDHTLVTGLERKTTLDGAVWGGGIEYALSEWFSLKVEYLHFDIGDTIIQTATTNSGNVFRFGHNISDIDTVKAGFNIRFNR